MMISTFLQALLHETICICSKVWNNWVANGVEYCIILGNFYIAKVGIPFDPWKEVLTLDISENL